jgi:hypothetical protein
MIQDGFAGTITDRATAAASRPVEESDNLRPWLVRMTSLCAGIIVAGVILVVSDGAHADSRCADLNCEIQPISDDASASARGPYNFQLANYHITSRRPSETRQLQHRTARYAESMPLCKSGFWAVYL